MKLILIFLWCNLNNVNTINHTNLYQDPIPLIYIHDFPIKAEDGSSYFSNDKSALMKKKYLLVINNQYNAFVQTKNGTYLYFKRKQRQVLEDGYKDIYQGDKGSFELIIDNISTPINNTTHREGRLVMKVNHAIIKTQIYGIVQELDRYNR